MRVSQILNLIVFIGSLSIVAALILYINRPEASVPGGPVSAGCPLPIAVWESGSLTSFSSLGLLVDVVVPLGALGMMGVVAVRSVVKRAAARS